MEKTTARLAPRPVLAIVGLAFVVAAIWAATALAGGGSSPASPAATTGGWGGAVPPAFVQSETEPEPGAAPSREDCPERGGAGGDSATPDGSSSSTDGV
jgi:hypothetical protein